MAYVLGGGPLSPSEFAEQYGSKSVADAYQALFNNWLDDTPTIAALLKKYGKPLTFASILKSYGLISTSTQAQVSHFEHENLDAVLNVTNIVTPSVGAGSNMTVGVETLVFNGANQSVARPGFWWRTPTDVLFYVVSVNNTVNPVQVVIRPTDSTVNLNAHVFANGTYTISASAKAEGTLALVQGMEERFDKYVNDFVIVEESYGGTGTATTLSLFTDIVPGQKGPMLMLNEQEMIHRNERAKSHTVLWGQQFSTGQVTETTILGAGTNVTGTQGVIDFANTYGNLDTYTAGAYNISDFESIDSYYTGQRMDYSRIGYFDGKRIGQEKSRLLKEYVTQTNVDLTAEIAGKMGVEVGFTAFKKDNREHVFFDMPEFNDPAGAGAAGYDYQDVSLVVPLGFMVDAKDSDGPEVPLIGYSRKVNMKSRQIREDILVSIDGTKTVSEVTTIEGDYFKAGYRSEIAAHCNRGNLFVMQRPV